MRKLAALLLFAAFSKSRAEAPLTPAFVIQLPTSVPSEDVIATYCVYTPNPDCSWVSPTAHRASYSVPASHKGHPVTALKAILFAPGAALETVRLQAGAPPYTFEWRLLPVIPLTGTVALKDPAYADKIQLSLTYLASWAATFFGIRDEAVPSFPIGQPVTLQPGNRFEFAIPDFASDPTSAAGSLHIWAREKATGKLSALLIPTGSKTKIDSLKVASQYPPNLPFTVCRSAPAIAHDRFGFAIRGSEEPCLP